jgi:hypothetical protein
MDYNGHAVLGVQISDELADGSVYMVTIDKHMQVCIATVMASSLQPYEPEEPLPTLTVDRNDYESTRTNLERLLEMQLNHPPRTTDELRACALTMSDLADVIDGQDRLWIKRTIFKRLKDTEDAQ